MMIATHVAVTMRVAIVVRGTRGATFGCTLGAIVMEVEPQGWYYFTARRFFGVPAGQRPGYGFRGRSGPRGGPWRGR